MKKKRTFEGFEQFLKNIYSLNNGGKFHSFKSYLSYVNSVIKDLGLTADVLLCAAIEEIIKLKAKLYGQRTFLSRTSKHQADIISGLNAFIKYARYENSLEIKTV